MQSIHQSGEGLVAQPRGDPFPPEIASPLVAARLQRRSPTLIEPDCRWNNPPMHFPGAVENGDLGSDLANHLDGFVGWQYLPLAEEIGQRVHIRQLRDGDHGGASRTIPHTAGDIVCPFVTPARPLY
jgi:hypothetical protein